MNKIGIFSLIGIFTFFVATQTLARPQFEDEMTQADGFIFDGPAIRPDRFPANNRRVSPGPTPPTNSGDNNLFTTTASSSPQMFRCMESCPVTGEFNPVCGSDGVTYNNPGRLSCAQFCGIQVETIRMGNCTSGPIRGR